MPSNTDTSEAFTPTDSGENDYNSRFQDNNIDLSKILEMLSTFPDYPNIEDVLIDFTYIDNGNNTYTLTGWKETFEGLPSTKCIIPEDTRIIL